VKRVSFVAQSRRGDCCRGRGLAGARQRVQSLRVRVRMRGWAGRAVEPMDLEDEKTWLRGWIIRMRTLLRFAIDPRVETGMKEFIVDAEERLEELQRNHVDPFKDAPGG
jgi:hypothetical protein